MLCDNERHCIKYAVINMYYIRVAGGPNNKTPINSTQITLKMDAYSEDRFYLLFFCCYLKFVGRGVPWLKKVEEASYWTKETSTFSLTGCVCLSGIIGFNLHLFSFQRICNNCPANLLGLATRLITYHTQSHICLLLFYKLLKSCISSTHSN